MTTRGFYANRPQPVLDPAPAASSPLWQTSDVPLRDGRSGLRVAYQSKRQPHQRVIHIGPRLGDLLAGETFTALCGLELVTNRAHPFRDGDRVKSSWYVCGKCDSYRAVRP